MRKILLRILTVILAICCIGLVACDKKPKDEATLVDFVNSTVSVPYGMNYKIAEYVFDTDGNRYALTANVTDNEGNAVEADRAFQVTKASYSVKYSVNFKGETVTKTVTVKGVSIPVIKLDENDVSNTILDFIEARLPEIKAEDLIDGEIQDIQIEVYKQTAYANIKMTDYVEGSNKYLGKSLGEYYWKLTVTNTAGVTSERIVFFECLPVVDWNFIPSVENATRGYSKDQQKSNPDRTNVPVSYVAKADIPTEGIAAAGGYGDAIKFDNANASEQRYITLEMNYSGKDYIAIAEKLNLPRIVYTYMIHTADDVVKNACYGDSMYSMLSASGYHATGEWQANNTAVTNLPLNAWQTKVIDVADFAKAFLNNGSDLLVSRLKGLVAPNAEQGIEGLETDFYLGEIKMVGANYVANNGEFGFTPSEANASKAYLVTSKEDVNGKKDDMDSFVAKNDIPTTGIDAGFGYGDAIKYTPTITACYFYVTLNYTVDEYKELLDPSYKSVKFTYMVNSIDTVKNKCFGDTYSLLSFAGYHATGEWQANNTEITNLPLNTWQTVLVSVEDFYKAIEGSELYVARLSLANIDFYLGAIEFVEDEVGTLPTYNGEFGFTPSAENATKRYHANDSNYTQTYMTATELATLTQAGNSAGYVVDNSIGYNGDAIKLAGYVSTHNPVGVPSNYTAEEFTTLYNSGLLEGATVTFYVMFGSATYTTAYNNDQRSFNATGYPNGDYSKYSLLSHAGYKGYNEDGTASGHTLKVETNKWLKFTVDFDENFYRAIQVVKTQTIINVITLDQASSGMDVYFGDIVFNLP